MLSSSPHPSDTEFRDLLLGALPELRAYARALTGNRDHADDLVQDIAVRLLAAQDKYRAGTNFRAWATMILRNRFIDLRRRARFHGGSIDDVRGYASSDDCCPDDRVSVRVSIQLLRARINVPGHSTGPPGGLYPDRPPRSARRVPADRFLPGCPLWRPGGLSAGLRCSCTSTGSLDG